jgi:hypothetical protein
VVEVGPGRGPAQVGVLAACLHLDGFNISKANVTLSKGSVSCQLLSPAVNAGEKALRVKGGYCFTNAALPGSPKLGSATQLDDGGATIVAPGTYVPDGDATCLDALASAGPASGTWEVFMQGVAPNVIDRSVSLAFSGCGGKATGGEGWGAKGASCAMQTASQTTKVC